MTNLPPPIRPAAGAETARSVQALGAHLGTLTTITLWHDYLCPWCYVGLLQAEKLKKEYGVTFDWRGAELFPPALQQAPRPSRPAPPPPDPNAPPPPPSRFDLFLLGEGIVMPTPKPQFSNMHPALLATEYAIVEQGAEKGEAFITAVYRAYWERQEDVADHDVLAKIAESADIAPAPLLASVVEERYNDNILAFDDDAYATGIRHVPTFIFGAEEVLAEAPYTDLAHATERFIARLERWKGK